MRIFALVISVIQHIQYLLLHTDCVVVPGLGAFVARRVPAFLDENGTVLIPPSRELSFNGSLSHDDGMLLSSITRRERISYECAREAVSQEVELLYRRLHHEGSVKIPRIGTLESTSYSSIVFEPDQSSQAIMSLPYIGLAPIQLPSIENIEEPDIEESAERASILRISWTRYAAVIALAIGVCLTLLTPVNPVKLDLASLNPSIKLRATTYTVESLEENVVDKYAGRILYLHMPDSSESKATVSPAKKKNIVYESALKPKHFLIVASARTPKEAKKYIARHSTPSLPLYILPSDGKYRVFVKAATTETELKRFRDTHPKFAAANPDAWIYSLD